MEKQNNKIIGGVIFIFCFFVWVIFFGVKFSVKEVLAEVSATDDQCRILADQGCGNIPSSDCQKSLESCAEYYKQESARIESDIATTQQQKNTLQNKIKTLSKKIQNLDYQINQSNLVISDLKIQITDTSQSIDKTSSKLDSSKEELSLILRKIYGEDQKSDLEIVSSANTLSDFFDNLMELESLSQRSKEILQDIKALKLSLENQKQSLDHEKTGLEQTVQVQTLQKQENNQNKKEQESSLKLTEQQYQQQLKDKQETEKMAAAIKAKIYQLIGVRKAVTYEEALDVAKSAAQLAGIRPALLLGILSQESSIGKNVGQCYLKNSSTGAGVVASSGKQIQKVMNPARDIPIFLSVIDNLNAEKKLGLSAFQTLVSCPMSFGWGGAMGPAQFIPSTWDIYDQKVEAKTGLAADPWDIKDAALAAAIYLSESEARYGSEGAAVQAYFCGKADNSYWCKWYQNNVLALATCHQQFIDSGAMTDKCQEQIGLK